MLSTHNFIRPRQPVSSLTSISGANLSSQFWTQLVLAVSALVATVVFIDQYKRGVFKTFRAKILRRKLTSGLKSLLPVIVRELQSEQANLFAIFRLRADLEALMKKGHLLFSDERRQVSSFLAKLSNLLAKYDADQMTDTDLDETVLLGQRAILELTEIGF